MAGFNKTIWINWFQGWENAPEITDYCVQSWKHYNPDWNVVLLDRSNCMDYCDLEKQLPGLNPNNIALSDLLRASLLANNGGVWVDSTAFCNKPLDDWILDIKDSFFLTRGDQIFHIPTLPRVLENFFLAARPDSYIFKTLYKRNIEHWKWRMESTDQFEHRYAMHNILLGELLENDPKVREIISSWDHIDVMHDNHLRTWGRSAHLLVPYHRSFTEQITPEFKNRIDSKIDPFYKLTYKEGTAWRNKKQGGYHPDNERIPLQITKGSYVHYLLNTI